VLRYLQKIISYNDAETPEPHQLSLHDALPISAAHARGRREDRDGDAEPHRGAAGEVPRRARQAPDRLGRDPRRPAAAGGHGDVLDRKSTRLNSSHVKISYAVFCLKKKKR